MSRILLVIGLASSKAAADPELVYLGRSGDAMRQAIAAATQPRLIIVPHVQGIPKNNPRASANEAAAAADEAAAIRHSASLEQLTKKTDELAMLLALAEDAYTVANGRADQLGVRKGELEAQLASAAASIETLNGELSAAKARADEQGRLANELLEEVKQLRLAAAPVAPAAAPVPAVPDPVGPPEGPGASSNAESGEERSPRRGRR